MARRSPNFACPGLASLGVAVSMPLISSCSKFVLRQHSRLLLLVANARRRLQGGKNRVAPLQVHRFSCSVPDCKLTIETSSLHSQLVSQAAGEVAKCRRWPARNAERSPKMSKSWTAARNGTQHATRVVADNPCLFIGVHNVYRSDHDITMLHEL